jgi:hypothetical protein
MRILRTERWHGPERRFPPDARDQVLRSSTWSPARPPSVPPARSAGSRQVVSTTTAMDRGPPSSPPGGASDAGRQLHHESGSSRRKLRDATCKRDHRTCVTDVGLPARSAVRDGSGRQDHRRQSGHRQRRRAGPSRQLSLPRQSGSVGSGRGWGRRSVRRGMQYLPVVPVLRDQAGDHTGDERHGGGSVRNGGGDAPLPASDVRARGEGRRRSDSRPAAAFDGYETLPTPFTGVGTRRSRTSSAASSSTSSAATC